MEVVNILLPLEDKFIYKYTFIEHIKNKSGKVNCASVCSTYKSTNPLKLMLPYRLRHLRVLSIFWYISVGKVGSGC